MGYYTYYTMEAKDAKTGALYDFLCFMNEQGWYEDGDAVLG